MVKETCFSMRFVFCRSKVGKMDKGMLFIALPKNFSSIRQVTYWTFHNINYRPGSILNEASHFSKALLKAAGISFQPTLRRAAGLGPTRPVSAVMVVVYFSHVAP